MTNETLEEAAKKYSNIPINTVIDTEERYFNSNVRDYDAFIEGAEWQAKKMYSEEEVIAIVEKSRETGLTAEYLLLTEQFKKNVSPVLVVAYALLQGVFVGGISYIYQNLVVADGTNIVGNTIMSTMVAFGTMLFLFKSGIIKVDAKFTRMMMVAIVSYLVIAVISLIAAFMGVGGGWGFYGVGGIGILLALFGVGLASFSLMLDFQSIRQAISMGLPEKESWRLAFGLTVTLVWLYLEMLRLFAILAGRRE